MVIQTAAEAFAKAGNVFTPKDLTLMSKWLTKSAQKRILSQVAKTGIVPKEIKVLRTFGKPGFDINAAGFVKIAPLLKAATLAGATIAAAHGIQKAKKGAYKAIEGQKKSSSDLKTVQNKALKKMKTLPKTSPARERLRKVLSK